MPTITVKVSVEEARALTRRATRAGQSKSAYVRSLIGGRIETAGDMLDALEAGRYDALIPRRRRRRRAAA